MPSSTETSPAQISNVPAKKSAGSTTRESRSTSLIDLTRGAVLAPSNSTPGSAHAVKAGRGAWPTKPLSNRHERRSVPLNARRAQRRSRAMLVQGPEASGTRRSGLAASLTRLSMCSFRRYDAILRSPLRVRSFRVRIAIWLRASTRAYLLGGSPTWRRKAVLKLLCEP